VTQLSCEADDVEPLLGRIAAVYGTAAAGITGGEFERARNKLASRIVLGGEKPLRRLFDVGLEWSHARGYRSISETLRRIESLEPTDVDRVLHDWPLDGPSATVIAGRG